MGTGPTALAATIALPATATAGASRAIVRAFLPTVTIWFHQQAETFAVELPLGRLSRAAVRRHARAILDLSGVRR